MSEHSRQVDAIIDLVRSVLRQELGNVYSPFIYGTFNGTEAADANLSRVLLSGTNEEARWCPKLASVGALTIGDTVICIKTRAIPLTIIGKPVGDISLASA